MNGPAKAMRMAQFLQAGQTSGLTEAALVYASEAMYKLIMKPTNSLVNLVVANQTFVDDLSGLGLRTVELTIVRVAQAACSTGVSFSSHLLYYPLTQVFTCTAS